MSFWVCFNLVYKFFLKCFGYFSGSRFYLIAKFFIFFIIFSFAFVYPKFISIMLLFISATIFLFIHNGDLFFVIEG